MTTTTTTKQNDPVRKASFRAVDCSRVWLDLSDVCDITGFDEEETESILSELWADGMIAWAQDELGDHYAKAGPQTAKWCRK